MSKEQWPKGVRTDLVVNGFYIYDSVFRLKPGKKFPKFFEPQKFGSKDLPIFILGEAEAQRWLQENTVRQPRPLRSPEELASWLSGMHRLAAGMHSWGDDEIAYEVLEAATSDAVRWLEFFGAKGPKIRTSTGRPVGGQKDPAVRKRNTYLRSLFRQNPSITPSELRESAAQRGDQISYNVANKLLISWRRENVEE